MLRKLVSINGLFLISVVVFLIWAGAVVGFAYGWLPNFVKGETITIADFTGLSAADARERASRLGAQINFAATIIRHDGTVPAGHVISHSPGPRQTVKATRPIIFTISEGPEVVVVPDVRGRTLREARFELSVVGLRLGDIAYSYSDDFPSPEKIITTMPRPRADATRGEPVDILISRGARPHRFPMPNLIGLPLAEAEQTLQAHGLFAGRVNKAVNHHRGQDETLGQSPAAGEIVMSGSNVTLTVNALPTQSNTRLEIISHRVGGDTTASKRVRIVLQDEAGRYTLHDAVVPGGKLISLPRTVTGEATLTVYEDDMQNPIRTEALR